MHASRKTILHPWHVAHGARMADFGGYEMPLWYSSVKNEHLSVLTAAGLFDTSHMAIVMVNGTGAADLLQQCHTRDLNACIGPQKKPLFPGRCVYGAFLDERGGVVDDAIVYMLAEDRYMIVVNAGMGVVIAEHLRKYRGAATPEIVDLSDRVGKIDIQGPDSARVLQQILTAPDAVLATLPYFSFKGFFDPADPLSKTVRVAGDIPILLSRTGYTGEFGFEIFVAPERTMALFDMLRDAGQPVGIEPCGLAARDSLRAGAVLPLSHQDIGPWPFVHHPWRFALPYNESGSGFTKSFVGRRALENVSSPEFTYPFVGDDLRKVSTDGPAGVIDGRGLEIGTVLTCVTDMGLGRYGDRIFSIASPDKPEDFSPRGLSCGFVRVNRPLPAGEKVELADARRKIEVTITRDIRPARTAGTPIGRMR